mmetsp:Transcript_80137/g.244983  ORF Transcript_80137/g.244983 Transcript_80137/m.244983 type:complete len:241 (+) Transcript_80137:884-1606(+)
MLGDSMRNRFPTKRTRFPSGRFSLRRWTCCLVCGNTWAKRSQFGPDPGEEYICCEHGALVHARNARRNAQGFALSLHARCSRIAWLVDIFERSWEISIDSPGSVGHSVATCKIAATFCESIHQRCQDRVSRFRSHARYVDVRRRRILHTRLLPHNVKSPTVVMRSPMPWGHSSLHDVAMLAELGPALCVSGAWVPDGKMRSATYLPLQLLHCQVQRRHLALQFGGAIETATLRMLATFLP